MEEGKPKASTLFRFFLHFNFGRSTPPHFRRIVFALFFCFFCFFAFFSLFFRLFFALFSHFFCISLETSSNFSFPDAAWTGSQGLPVPASRVPAPPCPQPPPPAPPPPTPSPPPPFPTCPVPAPAAQPAQLPTGPATKSRACKQLSFRAFVFQRLSQLTFTNGQIEKIRNIKKQRQRKKEREREREGVRASFVVAVDQSSHFFCTLVCFFWIAST